MPRKNLKKNNPGAELLAQAPISDKIPEAALNADKIRSEKVDPKPEIAPPSITGAESIIKVSVDPREEAFILAQTAEIQRANTEHEAVPDLPQRKNPAPAIENPAKSVRTAKAPVREAPQLELRPTRPESNESPSPNLEAVPPFITENPSVPTPEKPAEAIVITDREQPSSEIIKITQKDQIAPANEYEPTELTLPTDEAIEFTMDQVLDIEPILAEESALPITELAETEALAANEIIFDDEVMETFGQLAELLSVEHESTEHEQDFAEAPEPYEVFVQDRVILLKTETTEPAETNAFEQFLIERPEPEAAPDIETIIAGADSQPLEETLARLSFYLAETAQETDGTTLKDALRDVIEALPHSAKGDNAETEKAAITPELTQKLLILLQAAGYSNPRAVLVEFIGQHDLEFLLQATRYLHQLSDDINRHEFLSRRQTFTAMTTSAPLASRLGRAIMQYFFAYKLAPDL